MSDYEYFDNSDDDCLNDSGVSCDDNSDDDMGLKDDGPDDRVPEFTYEILPPDKLIQAMNTDIEEINNVINPPIPPSTVSVLLNHFKWDKQRLLEQYFEDSNKLFKDAKVSIPKISKKKKSTRNKQSSTAKITCEICFDSYNKSAMSSLPECDHSYCNECWRGYLTSKIDDAVGFIYCPESSCDVLVEGTLVFSLLKNDKKSLKTYNHLVSDSFVTRNRRLKWCPGPDCPNAIKAESAEAKLVICHCGVSFCFLCCEDWHDPISCKLLKKWRKKCRDDSETANWMSSNTKDCPKCFATIEKNGGCNHMICRKCKYDFCWMCLKEWKSHTDYYNCNKYDKDEEAETKKSESRAALQRYMFYYERYVNHSRSLKFHDELRGKVENIKTHLQAEENMTYSEVQFMQKAFETLGECRNVLMNTYVFAFYIKRNNHIEMFENNQRDLENAVEKLCDHLERQDLSSMNSKDMKIKVQDVTRYCAKRNKALLQHVHEGLDNGKWWEYREDGCE